MDDFEDWSDDELFLAVAGTLCHM